MIETFLGMLGAGASFAGLYKGYKTQKLLELRLDDVDKSVSLLKSEVQERLQRSSSDTTKQAWLVDSDEVAFRIYGELVEAHDALSLPVYLKVLSRSSLLQEPEPMLIDKEESAITIFFPESPIEVGFNKPEFLHSLKKLHVDQKPEISYAPIFLKTPNDEKDHAGYWHKKLLAIAPDQIESKALIIDKSYWKSRLDDIA